MKFYVSRTSMWDGKPCEEAFQEKYVRVDKRTVNNPKKLKCSDSETWYMEGTNHRVVNGRIARDFEATGWFINIDSLADLMKFIKKYGDIAITTFVYNDAYYNLEIYDDWRE